MHQASRSSFPMPGYLLPESIHALLHDVSDELQLVASLAATGEALDGRLLPIELKRAALAGYLRGVSERIECALRQCGYPALMTTAGNDMEGC